MSDPRTTLTIVATPAVELELRRGRSSVNSLHAHLVFVTKYRRPVFTDSLLTDCQRLMTDICADLGAQMREFNGETDHVHLLVHYPPSMAISTLVNRRKGTSAFPATPATLSSRAEVFVGQAFLVTVLLRRLVQRRTFVGYQAVHRTTEPTRLTAASSAGRAQRDRLPPGRKRPGFRRRMPVNALLSVLLSVLP